MRRIIREEVSQSEVKEQLTENVKYFPNYSFCLFDSNAQHKNPGVFVIVCIFVLDPNAGKQYFE